MREDRFLILADFLEFEVSKQPKYKFDMGVWADAGFNPIECHTAACAGGWATVIFKELSLKGDDPDGQNVCYRDEWGFYALAEFFEISVRESEELFSVRGAKTPKQVANNIRKFVKGELTRLI